jgi:hypothetical protein
MVLISAAGVHSAVAQGRRWVDPPAEVGAPPAPPPGNTTPQDSQVAPSPPQATRPAAPETTPGVRSAQPDRATPPPASQPPIRSAEPPTPAAPPPAGQPAVRSAEPQPPATPAPRQRAERPPGSEDGARPGPELLAAREEAARDLVSDYLDLWSAPNPLTLAASTEFYAPHVIFHGRAMSARALLEEKRRFVQRWPERRYRPRRETMGVACGPGGETCTVRSVFDFTAVHPERGRRSQGVATLELVVSFREDERPVITAENSMVHGRSRGVAGLVAGDADEP